MASRPLESPFETGDALIDRFNLSDIFEYRPKAPGGFDQIARAGRRGGRVAYWNMMVPRACPERLAQRLQPLDDLAEKLLLENKAAFYGAFHIEALT
jgi:S-adenosylmethionine-diacylglycerol 3-amino-3-carboxypropyl transferase